jgi:hypothetical protein
MLAKELHNVVCSHTIRRAIQLGDLAAGRTALEFVIPRAQAEEWLNGLPLATEPTGYHAPIKRLKTSETMTAERIAEEQARYVVLRRKKSGRS